MDHQFYYVNRFDHITPSKPAITYLRVHVYSNAVIALHGKNYAEYLPFDTANEQHGRPAVLLKAKHR